MNRPRRLLELLDDFVFRDRRVADQTSLRTSVFLKKGDLIRLVATTGYRNSTQEFTVPRQDGLIAAIISKRGLAVTLKSDPVQSEDESVLSVVGYPIFVDEDCVGAVSLDSRTALEFSDKDVNKVGVLSTLLAYELFQLDQRIRVRSPLSENLGRVLRSAREELALTQDDVADLVGTTRIAVSRWEAGAQPPSHELLRQWAAAVGLLAGGKPQLITVVDSTPQLIELLRRDPVRLSELSPDQFELLIAERLDRMGYLVQRTGALTLRDGGIDLIAAPKDSAAHFLLAVQVKHHRSGRSIGRDAVDRLLAWQDSAFRLGMLVTNTSFTKDAIWKASGEPARHFLRLRDFADLTRWLHGVFNSEFEWREIPDFIELAPGISVQIPKPTFSEVSVMRPLKNVLERDRITR